jgi:hypothetical protein
MKVEKNIIKRTAGRTPKEERKGISTHMSIETKALLDALRAKYNEGMVKATFSRGDVLKDAVQLLADKHGVKVEVKKGVRNGVEL